MLWMLVLSLSLYAEESSLESLWTSASALQNQGKLDEAERLWRDAIADASRYPERAGDVAIMLNNLGSVLQDRGEFAKSEACYRKALKGAASEAVKVKMIGNLISMYVESGQTRKALNMSADRYINGLLECRDAAILWGAVANLYLTTGRDAEAEELFVRARQFWERESDYRNLAAVSNGLGLLAMRKKKMSVAIRWLEEALMYSQRVGVAAGVDRAKIQGNLATAYLDGGRASEAPELLQQALDSIGPQGRDQLRAQFLYTLSEALKKEGRTAEARATKKKAIQMYVESTPIEARHTVDVADLKRR